jgi:flagellar biosynthesis repressor protein FlbT
MILGEAVIRNSGNHPIHLLVETPVPILRQRDILTGKQADTPCGRIYLVLQLMYVTPEKREELQETFLSLIKDVLSAAPSMASPLESISLCVAGGDHYKALRKAKGLLKYEQQLLSSANTAPETCPRG